MSLSGLSMPSLSIVALICSEPGVIVKVDLYSMHDATVIHRHIDSTHFALTPLSIACLAMLADRDMSSYELLVQLPINAIV